MCSSLFVISSLLSRCLLLRNAPWLLLATGEHWLQYKKSIYLSVCLPINLISRGLYNKYKEGKNYLGWRHYWSPMGAPYLDVWLLLACPLAAVLWVRGWRDSVRALSSRTLSWPWISSNTFTFTFWKHSKKHRIHYGFPSVLKPLALYVSFKPSVSHYNLYRPVCENLFPLRPLPQAFYIHLLLDCVCVVVRVDTIFNGCNVFYAKYPHRYLALNPLHLFM